VDPFVVAIALNTAGRVPTSESLGALEAGFCAPRLRDDLVRRAELLDRLDDARDHPLVLVSAPAGYGKTTLLAQWAERGEREFAWVRVEESESDPARLTDTIVGGLEWAGIDPDHPGPGFALVLDVDGALRPEVLANALLRVLAWLPDGSQVAVATRSEPSLPLARMRGQRMVFELGADDLSMSTAEGAGLLRRAGLELDFGVVHELVRRTEGWPVMLELAATALTRPGRGEVPSLAGDDFLIAEYLRAEIVGSLSRASASFLAQTSVLDVISGAACDAVLERTRSAAMLAKLRRANVPLRPIDPSHEEYRVHGLLREMLQTELRRSSPDTERTLHRRACDWYCRAGDLDRAVGHARDAGDLDRAGRLLWAHLPRYLCRGRRDAVQAWLSGITEEHAAGSAPLALAVAHSYLAQGNIAQAEHWARSAAVSGREQAVADVEAGVLVVAAWAARSGAARMGEDAARAYELLADDSPWRAECCLLRGGAALLAGDREAACLQLEEGVARGASVAPHAAVLCLAQLGVISLDGGDPELAGELAGHALALVAEHELGGYPTVALAHAVAAAAGAGEGRMDEAKAEAARCAALAASLDEFAPWYGAETRIMLARGLLALGDVPAAREQLADASRLARRTQDAVAFSRWFDDAWDQFDKRAETGLVGVASLTTAELRVLRFLPTHYAFHEIAERLHVSSNTVKTHVHAVYRKLDASSRSEAVVNATRAGLLGY
jgi:LuxR family maltose regulon positive regulatory protein